MSVENIPLEKSLKECVEKAAVVLERGGVILYPTDTLYGLGADSLNKEALEKIYAIKGRDEGKPIHSIVASLDAASAYGEVNDAARTLADAFLPGPLTLLLQKKESVPEWAVSGRTTLVSVSRTTFFASSSHGRSASRIRRRARTQAA